MVLKEKKIKFCDKKKQVLKTLWWLNKPKKKHQDCPGFKIEALVIMYMCILLLKMYQNSDFRIFVAI